MFSPESTDSRSSPDPDPDSSNSAKSPVLRPRPRLPAGPRTRKQTTWGQRQLDSDTTTKDQQHPSFGHVPLLSSEFPLPSVAPGFDEQSYATGASSSVAPLPSLLAPQPTLNPQPDPPVQSVGLDESFFSHHQASPSPDTFQSDASHLPPDHPISMPMPVPIPSRPSTPTPLVGLSSSVASPTLRKPSQTTVLSAVAPLPLPSTQLDLAPEPLPYKHLTLDAAHWTLTSTELQHLVSSAIRQSAKEQFIRLLPPSIIDTRMPEDSANIDRSWEAAASHWRFEAHRRDMLLRALSASGADGDLLSQLSGTLSNLDSHAQNLLHAAAHRTQLAAARDTHRASALAVALRKLNASYARRTRDLDKARAQIALLRSEIEETWKVAQEQAAEVDKLSAAMVASAERQEPTIAGPGDSAFDDEDDASSSALLDGASADLTMISRAEVVDVTGKAIAAQARLTVMQTNHHSGSRPQLSIYDTRPPSSPVTSGSDALQRPPSIASHVSRVSAAHKRSRHKSKANLRLPAPANVRSRSHVRGESGLRSAYSKSRNKKGKEPAQAEPPLSWIPADLGGSFLEMEGRPTGDDAGDGQVGSDGDGYDDGDGNVGEEPLPDSSRSAEPSPRSPLSALASALETQALSMQRANTSPPTAPSPLGNDTSLVTIPPPASVSAPEPSSQRSSSSLPPISAVSSAVSTLTSPPSSEYRHQPQPLHSQPSGTDTGDQVARGVDLTPDPASIFAAIASSASTATAAAPAPSLPRRGHSLELPSPSADGGRKQHTGGPKIRRSLNDFLHFDNDSQTRRRSVPLPFKGRGWAIGFDALASAVQQDLQEEPQGIDGLENGWEDILQGEA